MTFVRTLSLGSLLALTLFLLPACGSASKNGDDDAYASKDALIEKADINGDGRADMVRYFVEGKAGTEQASNKTLIRAELDLNFDGKIDKKNFYNPDTGTLEKTELNWDFDDNVDMINFYDADGKIEAQKIDRDFDGRFDVLKRYKIGLLYSRQIDSDSDGKMDLWEYFTKKGKVYRIGKDLDGDGKPEYFEDLKKK
jgi:hypothetical protein